MKQGSILRTAYHAEWLLRQRVPTLSQRAGIIVESAASSPFFRQRAWSTPRARGASSARRPGWRRTYGSKAAQRQEVSVTGRAAGPQHPESPARASAVSDIGYRHGAHLGCAPFVRVGIPTVAAAIDG